MTGFYKITEVTDGKMVNTNQKVYIFRLGQIHEDGYINLLSDVYMVVDYYCQKSKDLILLANNEEIIEDFKFFSLINERENNLSKEMYYHDSIIFENKNGRLIFDFDIKYKDDGRVNLTLKNEYYSAIDLNHAFIEIIKHFKVCDNYFSDTINGAFNIKVYKNKKHFDDDYNSVDEVPRCVVVFNGNGIKKETIIICLKRLLEMVPSSTKSGFLHEFDLNDIPV